LYNLACQQWIYWRNLAIEQHAWHRSCWHKLQWNRPRSNILLLPRQPGRSQCHSKYAAFVN
jgi:hypothetical protein